MIRASVWPFLLGFGLVALLAYGLRGQRAAMPDGTPALSEGQPTQRVDADAAGLELNFSGWSPLFQGIDYGHGSSPNGAAGKMRVHALRIHLDEPGVRVFGTPKSGPLETTGETAVTFLERHGLSVAVNAHFFSPCCEAVAEPKDIVGLAVSGGEVVSPPEVQGRTGDCILVVRFDGTAAVLDLPEPPDLSVVDVAVAGSDLLVRGSELVAPPNGEGFEGAHPRTAVGVDGSGGRLILLVIDGRQIGYSNGATLRETAAWMRLVGAVDALNLDGGGSTTMVRSVDGAAELINRPVGLRIPATLRWNGSHLGAVAAPLVR